MSKTAKTELSPHLQEVLQECVNDADAECVALANRMNRSAETVRTQLKEIYRHLEVCSKAAAIVRGLQLGIVNLPPPP